MKFNLAGKSILIVEDYPAMRKAIRDMLYGLDAETVMEADNGINAINAMTKHSFDVVLCDYNLGSGKNGLQVLEEARHCKLVSSKCVFVIISAEQATSMVLGVMDGKPDEYLTKPFNTLQLTSRLERSFARKDYLASVEKEIERGNLSKAIANCDRLLTEGDKKMHTQLLKLRAELAISGGDLEKAKHIYDEVLTNRELPWARLGLGIIEFHRNNIEQAISIFEQLVKDSPMLMEGYDWLSKAYEAANQPHDAQAILHQAVDLSPQSILRQKKLAVTADRNGNLDVAEKAYKATVNLGKNSIYKSCDDFAGLAKLYSKTNANEEALKTLKAMRTEYANSAEAELRAATVETEVYKKLGNEKAAEQALRKVISISDELTGQVPKELQLDIAKACFLNNQHEKAEQILNGLIKTHIDDEDFLNDVRGMQSGIGMDNHSEVLIQKTKQALIATNNQGVTLFKQGKYKEALDLFEQAMLAMPDNKTITLNMLKIIVHDLKTGDAGDEKMERARALFTKAQQIGIDPRKLGVLLREFAEISRRPLSINEA
ncbi:MAG: response regulator [Methylococcaceae bacterium]|nr:response regulator [Methylococcaceae bacterium]